MKEGIHPQYKPTRITCACGAVIETSSTKENIKVEICSNCHPFFTGKQKFVDSAGRVEKFKKKYEKHQKLKKTKDEGRKTKDEGQGTSDAEEEKQSDDTPATE